MKFDREGGLWIGTEKGLNRIAPRSIQVLSRKDGLREENVYPLFSDKAGVLWAGVWPNNLVKYENGAFKTRISDETVFVTSLFEDSSNRLWFGTIGNLYYLDKDKPKDGRLWIGTRGGLAVFENGDLRSFK